MDCCQFFVVFLNFFYFFQRSHRTVRLMPLFAAGREELCAVAQKIGGGFSAGGRCIESDTRVGSSLPTSSQCSGSNCGPPRLQERPPPPPAQPHPLPINLLYPELNMSRADVTLRLRGGQTEQECGPVEVKCPGVCRSGEERRRCVFWWGGMTGR